MPEPNPAEENPRNAEVRRVIQRINAANPFITPDGLINWDTVWAAVEADAPRMRLNPSRTDPVKDEPDQ